MGILSNFLPPAVRAEAPAMGAGNDFWYQMLNGGSRTKSGVTVNNNRALTLSAYYACLRNISEDLATLPKMAFQNTKPRLPGGKPGKKPIPQARAYQVVGISPNDEMGGRTLVETLSSWALGWGNGYGEILRDNRGEISSVYPIHPSRMMVKRRKTGTIVTPQVDISPDDDVIYEVRPSIGDSNGRLETFDKSEIFHLKGLGGDGLVGYSVLQFAAQALGIGLAAQDYGASFFGGGSVPSGLLLHPGKPNDKAVENIRDKWRQRFSGKSEVAVLREGMKYERLSIPPEEAQFLETRLFAVQEIARFFRMPLGKIQEDSRSTFSNVEQKAQEYVNDTLMPWIARWEEECQRKLDLASDQVLRFDTRGLLRGDHNARANFYRTMLNLGVMSPNDIRAEEDMNPIDDPAADEYYMQTNMASLEEVAEGADSSADPLENSGQQRPTNGEEDDGGDDLPANGHANGHRRRFGFRLPLAVAAGIERVRRWRR